MEQPIPKRIIQTGKHRDLSLKQRAFTANVRLLNPDFEWQFFDNSDVDRFVRQEYPELWDVFTSFPITIQKYDFFRYLAVYRLGGFYLDLDVLLAQGLAALCQTGCVFSFEGLTLSRLLRSHGMDWEIGNYAFGAAPGHPFLAAVIANCVKAQTDPVWLAEMMRGVPALSKSEHQVLYSTGPGLLSRTLAENPLLASTVTVLFPDDVSDQRSWFNFGEYGVHLMEGTWRPESGYIRRRLKQRLEAWTLARLIRRSRTMHGTQASRLANLQTSRGLDRA
jgi:hypothetical protein